MAPFVSRTRTLNLENPFSPAFSPFLVQFASVANLTFPNVYQNFLDAVNVLNFDLSWVVSPGCYMDYDFYDRLKLTTIGPVVTIGFIGIAYAVAAHKNRFSESALRTVRQKHAFVALLVSLFVYSAVCMLYRPYQSVPPR